MPSDAKIRENISLFHKDVKMPGGYVFENARTLRLIDLYYNGRFESGEFDDKGYKKFFYNISKSAVDIAVKFVDLDTKDIILTSAPSDQEWILWSMMHDLKQWMKENDFGTLLNDIVQDYPKYGHFFIKKSKKGKWEKANIQNLRFDPSSSSLEEDEWFAEVHKMSGNQIGGMNWNQKENIKNLLKDKKNDDYKVYEYYERKSSNWARTIKADLFARQNKDGTIIETSESLSQNKEDEFVSSKLLHEDNVTEIPYRELKFENIPGRRLGLGFVEYLFDNQVAENEADYLERKALFWKALHLLQTRDETVGGRNILTDVDNGDIIKVISELQIVPKDNSDLEAFNTTRQRWSLNAERKTFSFDIARGENLPSRTPLGVANLSAGMVASFFEHKRENLGIFVKKLLLEDVIPDFKNTKKEKHILTLAPNVSGMEKFLRAKAKEQVNKSSFDFATGKGKGFFPSLEERQAEEERILSELKSRSSFDIDIDKRLYDKVVKFTIDVITTGEQMDVGSTVQTLTIALQLIASNPAIITNPATRTTFFKLLELSGISPVDLNLMEESASLGSEVPLPTGGSVSAPVQGQPTLQRTRQQL